VVRRCVSSRNLVNEEAMAGVGAQGHWQKREEKCLLTVLSSGKSEKFTERLNKSNDLSYCVEIFTISWSRGEQSVN
jgi:hypothetical protein